MRGHHTTNRGVYEVPSHDTKSARRELSGGRTTETELLEQKGVVTEQVGSFLCTRERRDRAGL